MTREQAFYAVWTRLLPGPELGADPLWWPRWRWVAYLKAQGMHKSQHGEVADLPRARRLCARLIDDLRDIVKPIGRVFTS